MQNASTQSTLKKKHKKNLQLSVADQQLLALKDASHCADFDSPLVKVHHGVRNARVVKQRGGWVVAVAQFSTVQICYEEPVRFDCSDAPKHSVTVDFHLGRCKYLCCRAIHNANDLVRIRMQKKYTKGTR
jgi:hypothetical protein